MTTPDPAAGAIAEFAVGEWFTPEAEAGVSLTRAVVEVVAAIEAKAFARNLFRVRVHIVNIGETGILARVLLRPRAEAVVVGQATVSVVEDVIVALVRVVAEAAGVAETVARSRRLARIRDGAMGLAAAIVRIGSVVRIASAAMIDRTRMAVGAAKRLIARAASRVNVPPARRM